MADLLYQDVSVRLGRRVAVEGLSLALRPGELVALIGPNGAGKTSLLRAGLGLLPIASGKVLLNSADPRKTPPTQRARSAAYLPQARPLAWPMPVRDVVALGRFAYGAQIGALRAEDARAVTTAMDACDLAALAERSTDALSGGELARVHIARALAAATPMILADEPAAALDPRHAHQIMGLFKTFTARGGAALVTLHDLSLAARYADRIALMESGRLVIVDTPAAVLTPARIAAVFGVAAEISPGGALAVTGLA